VCIGCLLFRPVKNYQYNKKQESLIEEYKKEFYEKETPDNRASKPSKENKSLIKLKRDVIKYNRKIAEELQVNLGNKAFDNTAALDLSKYGIKNNIYGYIAIEKIHLKMAIYLGASDYNMSLGAVHVAQTSIPYGGKNTNAVIAGHCGYGGCDYFRNIENLEQGDIVKIATPFGLKTYTVTEKAVIEPSDLEKIKIQKEKDMITLFTCYPYPTSRYRMCVYCTAV
jgi:sortase A